ncbi:protein DCL, chloroplastic-like [Ipomoea triloba]|uniref:protein DCL, chloroplastic-like n=1 Tax=Ipomoea triloba TaxID=35885 RepID=UPI00125DDD17|nr:protein DCL, chloroplastic-like [Ipomoea triloba]
MISISSSRPLQLQFLNRIRPSRHSLSPPPSSHSFHGWRQPEFRRCVTALKIGSEGGRIGTDQDAYGSELLRKPVATPSLEPAGEEEPVEEDDYDENERSDEESWVDWEQKILEDTIPLVGFARMILHSGRYEPGDRLSFEHEKIILERFLPYHPEGEKKIGCGVNYITIGYHPDFGRSRCLFVVRNDGESVDFSYWKCIKGLIRKNYPLYADSFILRHFQRRTRE